MNALKGALQRQAKSRKRLREATAAYVRLRAADGVHTDTVEAVDREGRPVTVFIRLDIVSGTGYPS